MIDIEPRPIRDCMVEVPGSKSYTHRLLIAAALAGGTSVIQRPLASEDTLLTMTGLRRLGIRIEHAAGRAVVYGQGGRLAAAGETIDLQNSGTSMRLLTPVCALGSGVYTLTGTHRMQERPIGDLLAGMHQIGIQARSVTGSGCPPVEVTGGPVPGGRTDLRCDISSQFLSGLLLIAPYTDRGIHIHVTHGPVSRPYIDMTVDIMETLGVPVSRQGYREFRVAGGQAYRPGDYDVEPDCSQAGYFWAAAAVTGRTVTVKGIRPDTRQGDVRFTEVLARMGCRVESGPEGIAVTGGALTGVEADMADMPDMVPTLAVVAAFAQGTTLITNVAHLKAKESDRLASVAAELVKMGIDARTTPSGLRITGGRPRGTVIHTYNDHRIAMSFAVAGLKTPGVRIEGEDCVAKSFPAFWQVFEGLYAS